MKPEELLDLIYAYHDELINEWRADAKLAEHEVNRKTLIMPDDERARYEQCAVSLRFCARKLSDLKDQINFDKHRF